MIASTFLSKLRLPVDQPPEPGDVVLLHVLDLGGGDAVTRPAHRSSAGLWTCAVSGEVLVPGRRRVLMGWMPNDDDQELKYRDRFGL
jgi:hypothetical protein